MLAYLRLSFGSLLLIGMCAGLASAQIHGVAPSVTSFGFGGSNNPTPGVPASVTSVGPNGFFATGCCSGPLIVPPNAPLFTSRFSRIGSGGMRSIGSRRNGRRFRDRLRFPVGVFTPVYVPYAVPYSVDESDYVVNDDSDVNSMSLRRDRLADAPRVSYPEPESRLTELSRPTGEVLSARETVPASGSPEPVPAQPTTTLIYKDLHKADVQNYAIVGDTLFAFDGSLTHKIPLAELDLTATRRANDDRGVEFQLPEQKGQ